MKFLKFTCLILFYIMSSSNIFSEENIKTENKNAIYSGLKFRSIGPALMSGRISDIVIHPENENLWYVTAGSGGVWKTENSGTTWKSIFDGQKSYSIGCISLDPQNPNIVWVGSGENIGGRHVAYGDGIYKSEDAGESWKNMGLQKSEHISKIVIHPKTQILSGLLHKDHYGVKVEKEEFISLLMEGNPGLKNLEIMNGLVQQIL